MNKAVLFVLTLILLSGLYTFPVFAETIDWSDYSVGNLDGQHGWTVHPNQNDGDVTIGSGVCVKCFINANSSSSWNWYTLENPLVSGTVIVNFNLIEPNSSFGGQAMFEVDMVGIGNEGFWGRNYFYDTQPYQITLGVHTYTMEFDTLLGTCRDKLDNSAWDNEWCLPSITDPITDLNIWTDATIEINTITITGLGVPTPTPTSAYDSGVNSAQQGAILGASTSAINTMGTVAPVGFGVLIASTVFYKALTWFKALAVLKK